LTMQLVCELSARLLAGIVFVQKNCWDGKPRRPIGGQCCACPDCTTAFCTQELCWDGQPRRQLGNYCCACPEAPAKCASITDSVCAGDTVKDITKDTEDCASNPCDGTDTNCCKQAATCSSYDCTDHDDKPHQKETVSPAQEHVTKTRAARDQPGAPPTLVARGKHLSTKDTALSAQEKNPHVTEPRAARQTIKSFGARQTAHHGIREFRVSRTASMLLILLALML